MGYAYVDTPDPVYIETEEEAAMWAEYFAEQKSLGYDTETTGLDIIHDRIKFFSFAVLEYRICGPVRLLHFFEPILEDESIEKCMTNSKYDMHLTASFGCLIRGRTPDTVVQDFLVDENRRGQHGLKPCAKDYLGLRMTPFKKVFGSVGSVEKEVQTLVEIHDILEANDHDNALAMMVRLRKTETDETVVKALNKVMLSKRGGFELDGRQLLAIARPNGWATKTAGKAGYISDFAQFMGYPPVSLKEREGWRFILTDKDWLEEAHELLLEFLLGSIKGVDDPLEYLKLLVGDYASLDAWASFMLRYVLQEKLEEEEIEEGYTLNDMFEDQEVDFTRVLFNMERRGIGFDSVEAEKLGTPMAKRIAEVERKLVRSAGRDINLNSPNQLRELFYSKDANDDWIDPLGASPPGWTKGGTTGIKMPSTDKDCLEHWAERGVEEAVLVQEHRKLSKLYGTYVDKLPRVVDNRGRIHTSLNQSGAVTHRLSSSNPNLQNIPSRGAHGKLIRKLFTAGLWGDCRNDLCLPCVEHVPVPEYAADQQMVLLVADYEQLELRIMAHFSGDTTMIDAIRAGQDLHCVTSSLAGGYDYDEMFQAKKADSPTPEQEALVEVRANFKAVGFGLIYGIGEVKLGGQLGLPITRSRTKRGRWIERCPESKKLINAYFGVYPDAKRFIENTHKDCEEDLFVQTVTGRFRRLPDILSSDHGVAAQARRQSVNSIIQGSAADITNQAMLNIARSEEMRALGARMLLQIHDEIVLEVPNIPEVVEEAKLLLRHLMEDPFPMDVPIAISMDTAMTWGDAK